MPARERPRTARAKQTVYVGTADGRILISRDDGASFVATDTGRASGPVERIFVDPARPDVALAALGGPDAPHVLRTTNGGQFWDALDSNLPNAPAHGVTGERAAGAVYVATDRGVFWAQVDLDNAGTPNVNWISLSDRLPDGAGATDVRLDPAGIQLYVAVDGYGVYATAAPHRAAQSAAGERRGLQHAPGGPRSLLSVIGGRVSSVRGGNLEYPVLAAADDASQIQVPFDAVGPNVTLALATGQRQRTARHAGAAGFSGDFRGASTARPILQDADTGLLLDARKAAHAGARLLVSATGLGKVTSGMAGRHAGPRGQSTRGGGQHPRVRERRSRAGARAPPWPAASSAST